MSRTVVFAAAATFLILFSGIQAQVNVEVSFTIVFSKKKYVSQDDDDKVGCFVEGECLDSLLLTEISAETPEDCLVLCQVRICSCFQSSFCSIFLYKKCSITGICFCWRQRCLPVLHALFRLRGIEIERGNSKKSLSRFYTF